MSNYSELVQMVKELLNNRFLPQKPVARGLLGDGLGNVIVPGRPDFNYVRFNRASSERFEVFNKRVSQPVDGTPVLIGEDYLQPGLIQILSIDWSAYLQTDWGDAYASIQAHAPTHEWPTFAPGSDPVNVYPRSFTQLRTQSVGSGSNSVYVTPYEYDWTGTSSIWPGVPPMDFSAKPPTGSMLYMGVYLNPATNTLGVVSGSTTTYTDAIEPSIPGWPLGVFPSGYVRLYGGQAGIAERDIRPAQRLYNSTLVYTGTSAGGGGSPSGPAGGDLTGTYPDPRVVGLNSIPILGTPTTNQFLMFTGSAWRPSTFTIPDQWPYDKIITVSQTNTFAKYSTIQDANDNETGPAIVLPDGGTYNETLTLNSGSIGYSSVGTRGEVTIASTSATTVDITGAGIALRNLTVSNSNAGATATTIQTVEDNTILNNIRILKTTAAATTSIGLHVTGGGDTGTTLTDGVISVTAGTTKYGILVDTDTAFLTINGGEIAGDTADIRVNHANAFVYLNGPKLLGGGISVAAGTVEGWYRDADNNVVVVNKNYVYGNISGTARPNPLVNGSLLVWQRGTSFAAIANATYTADKYVYNKSGAMVHTVSQSTDVPTVAEAGIKIPYSLLIDCTTVDSSIAAGDFCVLNHWMEGYNFLDLAQRQFTLSFWVKATKTGVYCVAFRNAGGDRSWVAEYTVNTTATWEFKTVTVDASPTAGTWDYTTGIGIGVTFTLAGGSTFQTTAGAWQTGNFFSTANQVNACDSTSNDFRLALIDIAPGPVAPSPRLPDYEAEKARCLRYAYVLDNSTNTINNGLGAKVATTLIQVQFPLPVPMRIGPTLSHNITGYTAGNPGTTTISLIDYARNGFYSITGALTVSGTGNLYFGLVNFIAGTSWDGTAGNVTAMRVGLSVVAVFNADF